MIVMMLCIISRILCPTVQHSFRHRAMTRLLSQQAPARRVVEQEGTGLTQEVRLPALPTPLDDGSIPNFEPAAFTHPLTQVTPVQTVSRLLPVSDVSAYSPLRI